MSEKKLTAKEQSAKEQYEMLLKIFTRLETAEKELAELRAAPPAPVKKAGKESTEPIPRENTFYEVKSYFKSDQPPQCLKVSKWAWEAAQAIGRDINEVELYGAFETHAAEWTKYSQTMWEVWGYYRGRMIGARHIRMY